MLDELPAPLPKRMDFSFLFTRPVNVDRYDATGQAEVKGEDQDGDIRSHPCEGSLFSSVPGQSPFLPPHILPDTTLPPLPSSPLLTPYSTSLALPSLDDLPGTFSRKVHPAKLIRKREREREKEDRERDRERRGKARDKDRDGKEEGKEKEKKDGKDALRGWLPWEISRWGAQFRANPAHKMTKKSGKAMTTRMWGVSTMVLFAVLGLLRLTARTSFCRWI